MSKARLESATFAPHGDVKVVARVPGFALVKTVPEAAAATSKAVGLATGELMQRVGKALKSSGIAPRRTVRNAFIYSTYEKDPTKVVRRAADGTHEVGTLSASGRFKVSKTAA